ncbi:MAG: right-handed parallel beta-helix repeat-containing protein [Proteobacteria bacterium]|nr:right-handed parallel beta-helix repeat-containing protein [Pseudomonadota bacterium]
MKKILFTFLVLISGVSSSAIFQVNLTVQDHVDGNPGDGVCDIPTGGFCTLRAAIMEANALPGTDIIILPGNATIRLSIPGSGENSAATGDLDITDSVAIGAFSESTEDFPTIDANGLNDRVFHVLAGGSGPVSFVNFRVINGSAGFSNGGAINISINNQVNVIRVWFEDNTADLGGAIYTLSELDIVDSVFRGNAAVSAGGALAIFAPTQIDKSTIFENLNLNNTAQEAIFVGLPGFGTSSLTLRNSTVFNNAETGIYSIAADVSIRNSTIANNAGFGLAIEPSVSTTPDLRIRNSIFNQNETDCASGSVNRATDNWNITSEASFCFLGTTTTLVEDPKLSSIKVDADNWHRYYRPGFFSPVVDSAHPTAPGPGIGCDAEDQRGVVRAQDGDDDGTARCDRGAIELLEDIIFYDDFDIAY